MTISITLEDIDRMLEENEEQRKRLLTTKSVILDMGGQQFKPTGKNETPKQKEPTKVKDSLMSSGYEDRYFREAGIVVNLVQYAEQNPNGVTHVAAAAAVGVEPARARKTYHRLMTRGGLITKKAGLWVLTEKGLKIWKNSPLYGKGIASAQ